MYNYRLATPDDLEDVLAMAHKFYEAHVTPILNIPMDEDSVVLLSLRLIDDGMVVVAEAEGEGIIGMLASEYVQYPFNLNVEMVREVAFWVNEDHRNSRVGAELMAVAGVAASTDGVHYSAMVALESSTPAAPKLYKTLGYQPIETMWVRKISGDE